jgi:hypothetical protein
MARLSVRKIGIILIHAFVIWALCGLTISIGRSITSVELTLKIHLIAAPIFAFLVSTFYFRKYNYTSPANTAFIFLIFVIAMDAGLVAPVFEKSYEMFRSITGTWIPFILIFFSSFLAGILIKRQNIE